MRKLIQPLILFAIIINFIYVLSGILNFPIQSIDVISIWMLKTKILFFEPGSAVNLINKFSYSHPQYPILLPYLFYSIFKLIGEFKEVYVLILYPFIYLAILMICYKTLIKMELGKTLAMVFTYVYSMLPGLLAEAGRVHAGRADILILLTNWLSVYISLLYYESKKNYLLFFILFLTVIGSQIKLEGVFISLIFLFLPIKKSFKFILFITPWLFTFAWVYIRRRIGLTGDFGFLIPNFYILINRIIVILIYIILEMFNIRNWYVFWPVFLIVTYLKKSNEIFTIKVLRPSLIMMSVLFLLVYLFSSLETSVYIKSSVDRVMLQLTPFLFLMFSERCAKLFRKRIF